MSLYIALLAYHVQLSMQNSPKTHLARKVVQYSLNMTNGLLYMERTMSITITMLRWMYPIALRV